MTAQICSNFGGFRCSPTLQPGEALLNYGD